MWSPIPRTPTSCARSTWSPPNIGRSDVPTAAGPLVRRLFCPRTRRHPAAYTADAAGFPPPTSVWGNISCLVVSVRTAAAAAAAETAPPPETAGFPPCPPSLSCPSFLAEAPPSTPAGRCMSPTPPSCGIPQRTGMGAAPAAAAGTDRPCRPSRGGYLRQHPHTADVPPGRPGGTFCFHAGYWRIHCWPSGISHRVPESPPAPPRWDTDAPPPPPGNRSRPAPQTTG